jgi:hypothetical protein
MRFWQTIWVTSYLCIPAVVVAGDTPGANRWDITARRPGTTAIQRQAYEQLAKLCDYRGWQPTESDSVVYEFPKANPMTILRSMDVDAIPILTEALDDGTPSKTVNDLDRRRWVPPDRPRKLHVWKVNELVALIICHITDTDFFVGAVSLREIESDRTLIPEFQKEILKWYERNKHKTQEERKIETLRADYHHRIRAESWLGVHKSVKAVPSLVDRAETILAGHDRSEHELAAISSALGQIGDPKGLPVVTKACDYLASQSPKWNDVGTYHDLFSAFRGLARLGQKKEALAHLNRIFEKHASEMQPYLKTAFEKQLTEAAKW